MQKMITKELEKALPSLSSSTNDDSPILVHYFNPAGRGDWFGMTYNPKTREFFGYVSIFHDYNDELGYFSLDELESIKLPLGMHIERDIYWDTTTTLRQVKERYTR